MPSNAEYRSQAAELAAELNIEISTDGLNNADLAALVSDLKAKKRDAENPAAEDAQAAAAAEDAQAAAAAEEAQAADGQYVVAKRVAITTKTGILSGDGPDAITPEDLTGGEEAFAAFIQSGHIVKA